MQSSMTARSSSLAQFLQQYGTPSERGRFFTRSQIFIAYRAFLSQTKSSELCKLNDACSIGRTTVEVFTHRL